MGSLLVCSNLCFAHQYLIFPLHPALAIRQQYLSGALSHAASPVCYNCFGIFAPVASCARDRLLAGGPSGECPTHLFIRRTSASMAVICAPEIEQMESLDAPPTETQTLRERGGLGSRPPPHHSPYPRSPC